MACKDCIHAKDPMPGFPNQVFCDYIYLHISALPYYDKSERCDGYKPKATNGDNVRRMSDEELAAWFVNPEPLKTYLRDEIGLPPYLSPSESDILSWLKQEVE